ncbi:cyanamide hydratase [Calocera viscosa TUFC12733]|uniref:Cyanamide hydratase n=1 Tax=Calocera viscosa (strain TUFC12733) TaxID=1330018 RepID=A0A167NYM0_CALVF|nr:cyanamide hydratase [Calocera viscosa TUFC12733]
MSTAKPTGVLRGFTTVPCPADELTPKYPANPPALDFKKDLLPLLPDTPLVREAKEHLKPLLPENVWNHSHRAFFFAVALAKTQFPEWDFDPESYYLACLFHDIGCTPENLEATKLSFEWWGGMYAHTYLLPRASSDVADVVAETIFRHTDFVRGKIHLHGQLIQLGTLLDNHGARSEWINRKTVDGIVEAYPRLEWNDGFADAMEREVELKPYSHTTCFEGAIWRNSRANSYMKVYEN